MPKLYEYLGLIVLFYSNEHEPIHVHGKFQEMESKAEFIIVNGKIIEIRYSSVKGKKPLNTVQLKKFQTIVEYFSGAIVQKWINYFVYHKAVKPEIIMEKIK